MRRPIGGGRLAAEGHLRRAAGNLATRAQALCWAYVVLARGQRGARMVFGCGVGRTGVRDGVATESVTEASKVVVGGIGDRSAVIEPFMSALAPPPQGESPAKLLSVLLSVRLYALLLALVWLTLPDQA